LLPQRIAKIVVGFASIDLAANEFEQGFIKWNSRLILNPIFRKFIVSGKNRHLGAIRTDKSELLSLTW